MPDAVEVLLDRARQAGRNKQLVESRAVLLEAIAQLRQYAVDDRLASALRGLGEVERNLGERAAACAYYEEAVRLLRTRSDRFTLAHTIRHLGDVCREAGSVDRAHECYVEALALYRGNEHAPGLDLANAVRSMAVLREEQGEPGEAAALWREALTRYRTIGIEAGVAECSRRLARLGL